MKEDAKPIKALHVLVVDSDPCIRQLVTDCLGDHGFEVWSASGGPAMLKILGQQDIDLLILDANLPDFDSMVWPREIGKDSRLPIIFLVPRSQGSVQFHEFASFASSCLIKPFSPADLLGMTNKLIGAHESAHSRANASGPVQAYRFDGWELNLRSGRLMAPNGAIVVLTLIEFSLLATFLAHSGVNLSNERLLSLAGLPDSADAHETEFASHIARLRKKINPTDSPADVIVHDPRLGYRFTIQPEARYA